MSHVYSQWDGSQEFQPPAPHDLMRRLADEMLDGRDLRHALRRLLEKGLHRPGGSPMSGIQDLLERLRSARERKLQQYNLGSALDDIQKQLNQVIDKERQTLRQRLNEGDRDRDRDQGRPPADPAMRKLLQDLARKRLQQLDALPSDIGGRIKQLRDYDFMDPGARQQFEGLLKTLQQHVMQSYFQGLQKGIQSMTPEALRQVQQMVNDLNQLLKQRLSGEEPDFQGFMKKWGHFFPEGIKDLDQLARHIQQQMAQMESLLKSMTPEMRKQLQDMISSLLRDHRLQWDLLKLAANLQLLNPSPGRANEFPFSGDDPLTLQEALRLMGDMNSMDRLERDMAQAVRSGDASDINSDEVGRLLGDDARQAAEQIKLLIKELEEAGIIQQKDGDWELTPRAVRKIGECALQDIFGRLKSSVFGDHSLSRSGIGMERLDETKPYEYGDPFLIHSQKSVMNAVIRDGPQTPVQLQKDDFEVYRTVTLTQCSTVIMLDMSYSMMVGGHFDAGRKVALALDTLVRSRFPRDNLYVVAFSYFVRRLKPEMLLSSHWVEYGGGTNFQEALHQARLLLGRHKLGTRQIILVTDGEPTTYGGWSLDDNWPQYRRSGSLIQETLREAARCARENITLNIYMMERHRSLVEFVRLMARVSRGRAFFASPGRLGEYILVDYMENKRRVVR
ncbi:MAG: VWA domain-containing protein [Chloroflexi bacterium]|nr:VWA domain-containing protein [Chloroflexota bacterium]